MRISDWSSDVCSSDLLGTVAREPAIPDAENRAEIPIAFVHVHRVMDTVQIRRHQNASHVVINRRRQMHIRMHKQRIGAGQHLEDQHRQRRSEEHTSELQSLMRTSYAVFCLKKKKHK